MNIQAVKELSRISRQLFDSAIRGIESARKENTTLGFASGLAEELIADVAGRTIQATLEGTSRDGKLPTPEEVQEQILFPQTNVKLPKSLPQSIREEQIVQAQANDPKQAELAGLQSGLDAANQAMSNWADSDDGKVFAASLNTQLFETLEPLLEELKPLIQEFQEDQEGFCLRLSELAQQGLSPEDGGYLTSIIGALCSQEIPENILLSEKARTAYNAIQEMKKPTFE